MFIRSFVRPFFEMTLIFLNDMSLLCAGSILFEWNSNRKLLTENTNMSKAVIHRWTSKEIMTNSHK